MKRSLEAEVCLEVSRGSRSDGLDALLKKNIDELEATELALLATLNIHFKNYVMFGGSTDKIEYSLTKLLEESRSVESKKASH